MKSKLNIITVLLIFALTAITTGCTSSSYGKTFVPLQTNQTQNQYTLKIYTGGFAGPGYAKKNLDIEAKKFIAINKEFTDYKIISSTFELIPSGVTFIVEFIKETE